MEKLKIRELATILNKLCEEGKGNCDVVCRTWNSEIDCDMIYPSLEFNFQDDRAIIDFDSFICEER